MWERRVKGGDGALAMQTRTERARWAVRKRERGKVASISLSLSLAVSFDGRDGAQVRSERYERDAADTLAGYGGKGRGGRKRARGRRTGRVYVIV